MTNDKFSVEDAVRYGWKTFTANIPLFLGLVVAMIFLSAVPRWTAGKLFAPHSFMLIISHLVIWIFNYVVGMVFTRIILDIHDKGSADLSKLADTLGLFLYYIGGRILTSLIVLIGLILLIVPGVIWAIMFMFVGYLIVDKGLGPIEALQESRSITTGYKWDLFVFVIVVILLNVAGALCLLVGLLVTIPVTIMASAHVYRRLSPAVSR